MTIDDELTEQTRAALKGASAVREIKMFGGVGFMLNGNMVAAASHRGLLVRVGTEREDEALSRPGARLMIMRGRPCPGYVQVEPSALNARSVKSWVRLARAFVETLPVGARSAGSPRTGGRSKRLRRAASGPRRRARLRRHRCFGSPR